MGEAFWGNDMAQFLAAPARLAGLLQWQLTAPTLLSFPDPHLRPVYGLPRLLGSLTDCLGASFEPVATWTSTGRVVAADCSDCSQSAWTTHCRDASKTTFLASLGDRDRFRFEHQSSPLSSSWMSARPSPAL